MALYSHICAFCSQACLNYQLRKLDKIHYEFIHSFIHDCDDVLTSCLKICKLCLEKLGQFQLFIERCKHNFKKLALIREEHKVEVEKRLSNPGQIPEKESQKNCHNLENSIEIILHDSNSTMEHINSVQKVEILLP